MESKIGLKNDLWKNFCKYVSFNVLSMIGLSVYILADTAYVANGIGSHGLTALNLALPFYSLISGVGIMLGMGGATRYSILKEKSNFGKANKTFTQVIYSAIILGLILTFLGVFFSNEIAQLLGADKDVLTLVNSYLKTILIFSCVFIINNVVVCFVRNDNNPNLAMFAMLIGSFSNIVLDYVFIFKFNWGMFGAAFATGLAPIFSLFILSIHFIKKKNNFKLVNSRLELNYVKNILSLGVSSFVTEFSSGIIMLIFNFVILQLEGNVGVAAYGVVANLALIVVAVFTGIGQGVQPLMSSNYGAGNNDNIKKLYRWAILLATLFGIMICFIGITFPEVIVRVFNSEQNKILEEVSIKGIKLYFIAFFIMGINSITTAFFAAINKPVQSFVISIVRGFVAVVPLVIILSHFMGMTGVWLSIPLAELVTLLISVRTKITTRKSK